MLRLCFSENDCQLFFCCAVANSDGGSGMWLGFLSGRWGEHPLTELLLKWGAFGTSLQELWVVGSVPSDFSKMLTYSLGNCSLYCCLLGLLEPWASHWLLFEHVPFKYTRAEQRERHGQAILISILSDLKRRVPASICGTCYCSVGNSLSKM